jgi:hypothetical protein
MSIGCARTTVGKQEGRAHASAPEHGENDAQGHGSDEPLGCQEAARESGGDDHTETIHRHFFSACRRAHRRPPRPPRPRTPPVVSLGLAYRF